MTVIGVFDSSKATFENKIINNEIISTKGSLRFNRIVNHSNDISCSDLSSLGALTLMVHTLEDTTVSPASVMRLKHSIEKDAKLENVTRRELAWDEALELNDAFEYVLSGDPSPIPLEADRDFAEASASSPIRLIEYKGKVEIIEVILEPQSATRCKTSLIGMESLKTVLKAVNGGAEYVPYRDNALTKLLWGSLSSQNHRIDAVIGLNIVVPEYEQVLFETSQLLYMHTEELPASSNYIYSCAVKSSSDCDIETVRKNAKEKLLELEGHYDSEILKIELEDRRLEHERNAKIACIAHSLSCKANENIASLSKEAFQLECEHLVLVHQYESKKASVGLASPRDTWLLEELDKLKNDLEESISLESTLENDLKQAEKFELDEAFRDIILQAEFNLKRIRAR